MNDLSYLYVEGKNDFHVIKNLLKKHTIQCDDQKTPPNRKQSGIIYINAFGDDENTGRGIEELKVTFKGSLDTDYGVTAIGIIVDADIDLDTRWNAIRNIAKNAGDCDFPVSPSRSGFITTINRLTRPSVKLGVWIMPNNENEGMLEHFVSDLIPANNFLWQKAQADVVAIPEAYRLFSPAHVRKAELHTWLAWQETPGRPMGIGVTAGWFDHKSPLAQSFIEWIKALFEIK